MPNRVSMSGHELQIIFLAHNNQCIVKRKKNVFRKTLKIVRLEKFRPELFSIRTSKYKSPASLYGVVHILRNQQRGRGFPNSYAVDYGGGGGGWPLIT